MWTSTPYVDLFGGLSAYASNWDLLQGNGIAECRLFLKQTLFQNGIGEAGPAPITLAEASSEHPTWFSLLPTLTINRAQLRPNQILYADINILFEVYLDSIGSSIVSDPEILLRTWQWPLVPVIQ
jgi:hypothetical protein